MILKGLYMLLLGIFLALFVGIGITTFYPEPSYPIPASCMAPTSEKIAPSQQSSETIPLQCEREQNTIMQKRDTYTQVVSSLAIGFAMIFLIISMVVVKKVEIFSYGFLFGSMFTLLYSVIRGLGSNHAYFKFILICISLGIVMLVGYMRFVKEAKHTSS